MPPVSSKSHNARVVKAKSAREVSAPELLVRNVIRGLYEGRYAPGQRLVEIDLSQEYNVSRFVVREALGRLTAEGVVSMSFNRGAVIPRLTRKQTADIFLVMEKVFALAGSLAADNIDHPGHRELIAESVDQLLAFDPEGDYDFFEFGRACSHFFRTVMKLSENEQLHRVMTSLQIHLVRVQFRAYPAVAEIRKVDELQKIAEAISEGDAKRAAKGMSKYFKSLSSGIAALPERVFA